MGEVIRKNAAAADILADARDATTRATARGGTWQTLAAQALAGPLKLADQVESRLATARATVAPLVAIQASEKIRVDGIIGRISDQIWNDIGRPAHDAYFELMFPGGIAFYTEASDSEHPVRMELLADLIETGLHPSLDLKNAKSYATELRAAGADFESAIEAARKPRAQLAMYERMQSAAALNCQMGLVNYKRLLKSAGMSEAEIHTVIRDRPTKKPAAAAPAPAPTPASAPATPA